MLQSAYSSYVHQTTWPSCTTDCHDYAQNYSEWVTLCYCYYYWMCPTLQLRCRNREDYKGQAAIKYNLTVHNMNGQLLYNTLLFTKDFCCSRMCVSQQLKRLKITNSYKQNKQSRYRLLIPLFSHIANSRVKIQRNFDYVFFPDWRSMQIISCASLGGLERTTGPAENSVLTMAKRAFVLFRNNGWLNDECSGIVFRRSGVLKSLFDTPKEFHSTLCDTFPRNRLYTNA